MLIAANAATPTAKTTTVKATPTPSAVATPTSGSVEVTLFILLLGVVILCVGLWKSAKR